MANSLINLVRPRTVLVRAGRAVGTGSLIAPGKVLTCAHVVRKANEAQEKIEVYLPNPEIPGQSIWTEEVMNISLSALYEEEVTSGQGGEGVVKKSEYPDVALLEINRKDHELLKLPDLGSDNTHTTDQQFLAFGFQKKDRDLGRNIPQGVSLNYSGEQIDGVIRKLMFSNGLIRPGMSGAALMNWESGEVVGLVHMTMSPNDDLGAFVIPIDTVWKVFEQWSEEGKSNVFKILNSSEHQNEVKKQYRKVYPKYPLLQEYGWRLIALPIILFFALWWMFYHRGPIEESSLIAISFVALAFVGNLLGDWLGSDVSEETGKVKSQLGPLIFNKYLLLGLSAITLSLWLCFSSVWVHGNSDKPSAELTLFRGDEIIKEGTLDPRGTTKLTFFSSPFGDSLTLKAGEMEPISLVAKSLSKSEWYYPIDFELEPLILIRFDGAFVRSMKRYRIEVTIINKDGGPAEGIEIIDSTLQDIGSVLIGNRNTFKMSNFPSAEWIATAKSENLNAENSDIWYGRWKNMKRIPETLIDLNKGDKILVEVKRKSNGKLRAKDEYTIEGSFTDKFLKFD